VLLGAVLLTNLKKMKVTVNQDNTIQLEEVFNSIVLKTKDGEEMTICMRDSGFEFKYQGEWYFAKEGYVEPFHKSVRGNYFVEQNVQEHKEVIKQLLVTYITDLDDNGSPKASINDILQLIDKAKKLIK
jgi:hypothetical protein